MDWSTKCSQFERSVCAAAAKIAARTRSPFAVSKTLRFEARLLERGEDFLALGVRAIVSRLQRVVIIQAVELGTRLSATVASFDEPVV